MCTSTHSFIYWALWFAESFYYYYFRTKLKILTSTIDWCKTKFWSQWLTSWKKFNWMTTWAIETIFETKFCFVGVEKYSKVWVVSCKAHTWFGIILCANILVCKIPSYWESIINKRNTYPPKLIIRSKHFSLEVTISDQKLGNEVLEFKESLTDGRLNIN